MALATDLSRSLLQHICSFKSLASALLRGGGDDDGRTREVLVVAFVGEGVLLLYCGCSDGKHDQGIQWIRVSRMLRFRFGTMRRQNRTRTDHYPYRFDGFSLTARLRGASDGSSSVSFRWL